MASFSDGHTEIRGLGAYTPPDILSSREVMEQAGSERFGLPPAWLERVVGVKERRVAPEGTLPSEISKIAAQEALDRARLLPNQIDMLVYTGMNRDHLEPSTGHVVANKLGIRHAICLDLTAACHGFAQGTHYADVMISQGQIKNALIVSGETNWRIARSAMENLQTTMDKQEFMKMAGSFTLGDGAGAMVLSASRSPERGFVAFSVEGLPQYADLCVCDEDEDSHCTGHMDMTGIVGAYMEVQQRMYEEMMTRIGWCAESIDWFVHHQVGKRLFKYHESYLGIDPSRISNTFATRGNLTSATIPTNLHSIQDQLDEGSRIYIAAAGSGLSLSQAAYNWAGTA